MEEQEIKFAGFEPAIHSSLRAGLFDPAGQWMEARGSTRLLGGNPWAQEVLVRHLVGLFNTAREGWEPSNPTDSHGTINVEEATEALKTVIRFMREKYPDWASLEPIILDSDFGLPNYPGVDPQVKDYVERVVLEGDFNNGGIN